ncbi:MAG: L,D-transpeptidase [Verrucomicrobiota bacterium]
MKVASKIGASAPLGAVFKSRMRTGEVLPPNAPGRDPIVTRILWLRGLEARNADAYGRGIYIHGTPVERLIGRPASYGCIRMRSRDVVRLFDAVPVGARIECGSQPRALRKARHTRLSTLNTHLSTAIFRISRGTSRRIRRCPWRPRCRSRCLPAHRSACPRYG